MKISVFLEAFEPEFWGGREKRWSKLLPEITKEHEITIFADFTRILPIIAFPDIHCSFVNIGPLPIMYGAKGGRSLKHAFAYTWQSRKLLRYKADLILTDQTPLISIPILRLISFLLKCELSVTWHEIWSLETWNKYSKRAGFIGIILQTFALLTSKNIVVPSMQVFEDMQNKFFSKKAEVIPNGIDTPVETKAEYVKSPKKNSVKLLYVGRLIKHKNCDFLLRIMTLSVAEGRDWHLTIVGTGPIALELKASLIKLHLEDWVTIESNIPSSELDMHYRTCDVFLFPSEREGFGISVSEAISKNVPVIVYDVPENAATNMINSNIFGRKINSLNSESWVHAIAEILESKPDQESNIFHSGLQTWGAIGEQYLSFLTGIKSRT